MLLPIFGKVVTGGRFPITLLAVFGWVIYAATAAVLMPYGSLAAVTGMHVRVFAFRVLESLISLGAVAFVLFVLSASASWVPWAMSLGTIVLGLIIRQYVLIPQAHADTRSREAAEAEAASEPGENAENPVQDLSPTPIPSG